MTDPAVPALLDETSDIPDDEDAVGSVDETEGLSVISPVVADRADAPVSVITERFFRAIIEHVPLDRIEELHLFSPLKQGGSETGIAVIAARVPVVAETQQALTVPELPLVTSSESTSDSEHDDDMVVVDAVTAEPDIASAEPDIASAVAGPVRHTVYTARYRLVQKGPERGKWEADVVAEAEAPLLTVEMVVRGVQRRAGEEGETLRFSATQLAKALQIPWPPVNPDPAPTPVASGPESPSA